MEWCSSSSGTNYQYGTMMEISSLCSRNCFGFLLNFLDWFEKTIEYYDKSFGEKMNLGYFGIPGLKLQVKILQTLDLYLRNCRKRKTCLERDAREGKAVISFRLQHLIIKELQDLESAYIRYMTQSGPEGLTEFKRELHSFEEDIELFFKTEIKAWYIDFLLDHYWLQGDPGLVIDFLDSLMEHLEDNLGTIQVKLKLLKSFILFAMHRCVGGQQMVGLVVHTEVVALNAYLLTFDKSFNWPGYESCREMELRPSQMLGEKLESSNPHVRETYTHILMASKLSKSLDTSALEKNKHIVVDFIDGLAHYITELLGSCTNVLDPVMKQMLKLLEGLSFLAFLARYKKFNELSHEVKNLIGVVVCDAAITIFSISLDQLVKEGLGEETDLALSHLLKALKFMKAEVTHIHPLIGLDFPRINELGSVDFLLKNLEELAGCDEISCSVAFPVDQIKTVQNDLQFLRSFLEKIKEQRKHNEKLQSFWDRFMEIAHKTQLVIDWTIVGDEGEYCLDAVASDIHLMKIEVQEIYGSISWDGETKRSTNAFSPLKSRAPIATNSEDLVGFDNELKTITQSLTCGSKQLNVVQIVGMAGLGKTTLANRVYNSTSIMPHFHERAWCTVSQLYSRGSLLVQILHCIDSGSQEENLKMDECDLTAKLKKVLLRKKYLVVLDDMWDIEAYHFLERSLPNDANGSRVLITSRLQHLEFKFDTKVHHLQPLSEEESWKLLQRKLFGKKECPPPLSEVGFQIAKACRGLPLTIVLVAGIIANTEQSCWEEVRKGLSSKVLADERCMEILGLSYRHLPDDLKSCLLYFAAFQEDESINVRNLLWLWISEGFVQKTAEEISLEDLAEEYFNALVNRSLLMVSKQRTLGGAKTCRLHDLVYEFSVKKAKEENFLHRVDSRNDPSVLTSEISPHRVCYLEGRNSKISEVMLLLPNLRTLKSFGGEHERWIWLPRLLRVLDLRRMKFGSYFPVEVLLLVHLRYLALHLEKIDTIPSAIANLSRLQIFLVTVDGVWWRHWTLPMTIWNIKTLRHLYTRGDGFIFPVENLEEAPCLDHLDTLSLAIDGMSSESLQRLLTKFPNLLRLNCRFGRSSTGILVFDCLSQLESLHVTCVGGCGFKFPLNLKELTLSLSLDGIIILEVERCPVLKFQKLESCAILKCLNYVGYTLKEKNGKCKKESSLNSEF